MNNSLTALIIGLGLLIFSPRLHFQQAFPHQLHTPYTTRLETVQAAQIRLSNLLPEIQRTGFVEFDDQGWFWDVNQVKAVEQMIRSEAKIGQTNIAQGIVMFVFVHGWKNNAATSNDNVEVFRKTLASNFKALPNTFKPIMHHERLQASVPDGAGFP